MKNIKKIILLTVVLLMALIFIPSISKAATQVSDEDTLHAAIESPDEDNTITLMKNIELTKPISITDKTLIINGSGFTISANTDSWVPEGANSTLITAGANANVTLNNIKLKDAVKYGVQSYNGGHVILDDVTISGCKYGGVLANAGTVEIKRLNLGRNGGDSNNGIEIAKGFSVSTGDNQPTLIMNGTLTSSVTDNVVYIAINDKLSGFEVQNTPNTINKILSTGNQIVITDQNNTVLYKSNTVDDLEIEGETFIPDVIITLQINDKTLTISVPSGTILTQTILKDLINLDTLQLSQFGIEGFFADENYTTPFNFETPIKDNTTIYIKLTEAQTTPESTSTPEPNKDVTPKTGVESAFGIASLILIVSIASIIVLKRKEN